MINAVNVLPQTIAANGNVLFSTDRVRTNACNCGGCIQHDTGSGLFALAKAGIYKVTFNANITSDTAGGVALAIRANGENVGGTEMDYTVVTAGDYHNVSASTLIRVTCGTSKTVSVGNALTTAVLAKDVNIIIERVA